MMNVQYVQHTQMAQPGQAGLTGQPVPMVTNTTVSTGQTANSYLALSWVILILSAFFNLFSLTCGIPAVIFATMVSLKI